MKITYFQEKSLKVDIQHEPDKWVPCFTLPNVKIPAVAYLGFSAETGELSDNHDIISVETRNLYMPEAGKGGSGSATAEWGRSQDGKKRRRRREGGGWGWFFIKFCGFGFLLVGVYAGYTAYRTSKSKSRF
jgi:lectin, mannose-binding 2